jgi:hypothetical protein
MQMDTIEKNAPLMSARFKTLEQVSGLAGFLAGLVLVFLGFEMFPSMSHTWTAEVIPAIIASVWGLALILTSGRGGTWRVYFRLSSLTLIIVGTVLAALLLPDLHRV